MINTINATHFIVLHPCTTQNAAQLQIKLQKILPNPRAPSLTIKLTKNRC